MGDNLQNIGSWNEILFMNVNTKSELNSDWAICLKKEDKSLIVETFPSFKNCKHCSCKTQISINSNKLECEIKGEFSKGGVPT